MTDTYEPDILTRLLREAETHPPTEHCPDPECVVCSVRDCPDHEPLHYHHDGCPCCDNEATR